MKNLIKKSNLKNLLIISMFLLTFIPHVTLALKDYQVMVVLPGIGDGTKGIKAGDTNFQTWLPKAFDLTIAISMGLAFVMITMGGVMYATSDAISGKTEGRKYVKNALAGLFFVIGAYVILNTINPQILNFKLLIEQPKPLIPIDRVLTGTELIASGKPEGDVRSLLGVNNAGSRIQTKGPCPPTSANNCVNLAGLQYNTIAGIKSLQKVCNCDIFISGGTEPAHTPGSEHYRGTAVDVRDNTEIRALVTQKYPTIQPCKPYPIRAGSPGGVDSFSASFTWEPAASKCSSASGADHWHISYGG